MQNHIGLQKSNTRVKIILRNNISLEVLIISYICYVSIYKFLVNAWKSIYKIIGKYILFVERVDSKKQMIQKILDRNLYHSRYQQDSLESNEKPNSLTTK